MSVGMHPAAQDVEGAVIQGAGHWVAEQAPENLLAALTTFLTLHRETSSAGTSALLDPAQSVSSS